MQETMKHKLLVIDDDDDFRSLLSDLYLQADYNVEAVGNPFDALRLLNERDFDLCVTDQSMPELKGIDFIEKCRKIKPHMPIIMISAYLSEEQTTKLNSDRVEVFHKPLNIMSLLRKTADLIASGDQIVTQSAGDSNSPSSSGKKKASQFQSFTLKADASKRFKKEIDSIDSELPNMVIVGDEGTHFDIICKDIEAKADTETHEFVYLQNKKINVFEVSKIIESIPEEKSVVVVPLEAYSLVTAQKQTLLKLNQKSGPFSQVNNQVKFIFCLHEDLDTLFANGEIDEDFYLLLGQKEIYVPRLNLCKEDVPEMALRIVQDAISSGGQTQEFAGIEPDANEWLATNNWEKNYESLKNAVHSALRNAAGDPIKKVHFVEGAGDSSSPEKETATAAAQVAERTSIEASEAPDAIPDTSLEATSKPLAPKKTDVDRKQELGIAKSIFQRSNRLDG